jgi:hypothetical protein
MLFEKVPSLYCASGRNSVYSVVYLVLENSLTTSQLQTRNLSRASDLSGRLTASAAMKACISQKFELDKPHNIARHLY